MYERAIYDSSFLCINVYWHIFLNLYLKIHMLRILDFLNTLMGTFITYVIGALSDIVSECAFFQRPVGKLLVIDKVLRKSTYSPLP